MLLFHGTTIENALNIVKNGFSYSESVVWNCSLDETYFFPENLLRQEYDLETSSDVLEQGLKEAFEQSMITLAIQNPKDYRGAVLVFDSDLMNNKDSIEPDYSCENMDNRAVALRNPDMNGLIGVYVMTEDVSSSRLFTLAQLQGREYIADFDVKSWEQNLIDQISDSGIYVEDLDYLSYEKIDINYNKNQLKVA